MTYNLIWVKLDGLWVEDDPLKYKMAWLTSNINLKSHR
jgi:hypothetical protein